MGAYCNGAPVEPFNSLPNFKLTLHGFPTVGSVVLLVAIPNAVIQNPEIFNVLAKFKFFAKK